MSQYPGWDQWIPPVGKIKETGTRVGRQPERAQRPTAATGVQSSAATAPLVLRMRRRLESPNASRGGHWRVRHRISQEWEDELRYALWMAVIDRTAPNTLGELLPAGRMRVTVERHVPSRRNFIRDDDNLRFSVKPLLDALKRQGYIKDDSRKWLEHPTPTQHVSADGNSWTVVTITAVLTSVGDVEQLGRG